MVEPPNVGFTGVVWDARPTERLAKDLTTGPGAAPMAEAAAAWAKVAAAFGEAVIDYPQIMAVLRRAWKSDVSGPAIEHISQLEKWLLESARAAGENAAKAGVQVVAYEVAKLAMPAVVEIAAVADAKEKIENLGTAMGAPLMAAASGIEEKQQHTKAAAARVMQVYEAATAPLAAAWEHQRPPVISTGAALAAERAAAQPNPPTNPPAPQVGGVAGGLVGGALPPIGFAMPERVKTQYRHQSLAQPVTTETRIAPAPVPVDGVATTSVPPMAPPLQTLNSDDEEHTPEPRAGAAAAEPEETVNLPEGWLGVATMDATPAPAAETGSATEMFADAELAAAPSVLGSTEERR